MEIEREQQQKAIAIENAKLAAKAEQDKELSKQVKQVKKSAVKVLEADVAPKATIKKDLREAQDRIQQERTALSTLRSHHMDEVEQELFDANGEFSSM